MADEIVDKALTNVGASNADLNPGEVQGGEGVPKAPVDPGNTKPEVKPDPNADKGPEPVKKGPAELAAAQKLVDDAKAAEEAEKAKQQDDWKDKYVDMGDPASQAVVGLLKEANVSPVEANSIFSDAMKSGKLEDIKWDVLEARLGKDKMILAKSGIEQHYNEVYKVNVATTQKVHEIVGGEDNWKKVASWVKGTEVADPKMKPVFDSIRKGIDAGGRLAELAAQELRSLYEKHPGNNGLGTQNFTQADKTVHNAGDGQGITKAVYLDQMKALSARNAPAREIEALRAQRKLGMQRGL